MKITATIEFDNAAEAAAFFGQQGTHGALPLQSASAPAEKTYADAPAPASADDLPFGEAKTGKPAADPAQAAIAEALAAREADKAKGEGDAPKRRSKKQDAAPATTEAPAAQAPTEAPTEAPVAEPAAKQEEAANSQPTATEAPETDASPASDQGFFGFTDQDANAKDASTSERVFTHKQIHDTLFAWSKLTDRNTFAALMARCEVASVNDLKDKADLYPMIIETVENNITKNGKGTRVEIQGDTAVIV